MTDAREIIGHWPLRGYAPGGYICKCDGCGKTFEGDKRARQCLPCAATSAGFRILGPDEIDGPTVERCAEVAEDVKSWRHIDADFEANQIATAIRAIKEKRT